MTGRQDIFQQAMNQGHSAAWDQLWDRAAGFYRQALEEFPDHPQGLVNLGLALFELQDYDSALRCYQRAARLSPEDPLPVEKVAQLFERTGNLQQASRAFWHAAELYLKNRDVNKAIENWSRVTHLDPENLPAHSRLALIYERTGEKLKAVSEYLALASLLQSTGEMEKAARSVSQALQVSPNNPDAIEALTFLRDRKPLPRPARPPSATAPLLMFQVRQLEPSQALDQPDSGTDPVTQARQRALTQLAGMLFDGPDENHSVQLSRRDFQSLFRGAGPSSNQLDRARILPHLSQMVDLQTHGQNPQAAEELERAIEYGLDHAAAHFDLGFLYTQGGRLESAARQLQSAVKHSDFALGSRLLLGDIYRQMGRMKEASLDYLEALKLADAMVVSPDQADDLRQLYEPLIESQRHYSDPEVQSRLCENVHSLLMRPDWRAQLIQARRQLPAQEQPGGPLIPLAEIITESRSSQVIDLITNIHKLANEGYLRSAMEESFYALQYAPTYLPLHTFMGELLLKQDRLLDAIAKFMVVAHTYSTRGETDRAIEIYHRVIELAPMDLAARSELIDQLVSQGEIESALTEYIDLAGVYYNQADLEMAHKTYTEALRLAQQSKVDRSWRVRILHHMADINLQSLDWRQALRIFEQIRTLQPDDEPSRTSLIELNFRLGQEPLALAELDNFIAYLGGMGQRDKTLKFVEGLVKEDSDRPLVRRRLADLYHQDGRDKEAIDQLDAAGEALLESGDRHGALQVVETILAFNPPNRGEYERLYVQLGGKA